MSSPLMPPAAPYCVLCVDDEASGLKLRKMILESKGYSVSTAGTVVDALALFKSRNFALVVTDHLLGRETGTAMAKEMRRLKPNVPIIVLSGTTDTPEEIETADAFISKGEGTDVLLAKVDELAVRSRTKSVSGGSQSKVASSRRKNAGSVPAPSTAEKAFLIGSETAQLLASIVESSDDAIFSKALDGPILSWNKAAERMFGYRAEEIIGKPISALLPSDRPNEAHDIVERLQRGERIEHFETVRVTKDGHLLTVSLTISPIRDSGGQIIGASTICRDITRSKLAEQSLRNSEKLAVAGRMAATVAHEINNPLEAVMNALYLLAQSYNLDSSDREFLTAAQDELAKIRQITTLTLGFHRGADRPQNVRVIELIDNVLSLYGRKFRTLGIAIETRYEADIPVQAFPAELRQVFSNLIVNAADALEKSGDKLLIHVFQSRDWTNLTQKGLRITISDNGSGIPSEKQTHIFEPFYTTKGDKGTGIGLWVSLEIVQKYGGKLRFRSTAKPGSSGTIFCVFLPILPEQEAIAPLAS